MTMAEVQVLLYADAILRQRGYQDIADQLTDVVAAESDLECGAGPAPRVQLRAVS